MKDKIFIAIPRITSTTTIEAMRLEASNAGFCAIFAIDVISEIERGSSPEETTTKIFHAICHAMHNCKLLIANLTPCLGVEPDSDVIFQLGYMAAQGKPVFSYTNDSKPLYERVRDWNGAEFIERPGNPASLLKRDKNGMRIENMGIKDHSKTIDNPGPDSYNEPMLEGSSFTTGSKVLTPKMFSITVHQHQLYSNIFVFAQAISDAKQSISTDKKLPTSGSTPIVENHNAIYLTGPGVLLPEATTYFTQAQNIIQEKAKDITVITPIEAQQRFSLMPQCALENGNNPHLREFIYRTNTELMQSARIGVFNLTPHRGVAAHSATIFEMGYMVGKDYALKRATRVYGFSTSSESLYERIEYWFSDRKKDNFITTASDYIYHLRSSPVYSEMIDGAILASGGRLSHRPTPEKAKKRNLTGSSIYSHLDDFTRCAEEAVLQLLQDRIKSDLPFGNRVYDKLNFWASHTKAQESRNQEILAQQRSPYC